MIGFKHKSPWDSAIAVLEDNIFSNDIRKWGSAISGVQPPQKQIVTPAEPVERGAERRREPRFSISIPVYHKIKGKKWAKWKTSKSIDVSQNGIRISVDKPVSIGTNMSMKIKLPNQAKKVKMEGVVVWQKPSWNSPGIWECGVAFENLRRLSKKERIIAFMADRLCALALKENHGMKCRPASTRKDLIAAYHLVYQEYLRRGYCQEEASELCYNYHVIVPGSKTFILEYDSKVIGTVSLFNDSLQGLPIDAIFSDKTMKLRTDGKRFGEVGLLALDHRFFGHKSFALTDLKKLAGSFLLFKILFDTARIKLKMTDLFIMMHPRHKELYQYLQFKIVGPVRNYHGAQGKPALPMRLNIQKAIDTLPKNLSIRDYFVEQLTDEATLDEAPVWDAQLLQEFLHKQINLWSRLDEDKRDFLRRTYSDWTEAA